MSDYKLLVCFLALLECPIRLLSLPYPDPPYTVKPASCLMQRTTNTNNSMDNMDKSNSNPLSADNVLDAILNGIVAINTHKKVVFFNHAAEDLFEISYKTAKGKLIEDLFTDMGAMLIECLGTGRERLSCKLNEGRVPLIADIHPIRSQGQLIGAVGSIRKLAEVEQIQNRANTFNQIKRQLDAIFDSSHDGLFITDGNGKILKCNRGSERLIGHMQEEILGKNVEDLVAQGYIDKSVTVEVLKKKTSLTILQKLRNGNTIIVTGSPVFNEAGDIEFVVTNERDITALNRMKIQLREYRALARKQIKNAPGDPAAPSLTADITAVDRKTRQVFQTAQIVAKFDTTVLIQGETGVGKGRVARFIHETSHRESKPFIQINCGAIPDNLIESELFGYRKGAFTGADAAGKPGLFQMADTGTLFLDEIAEIPLSVQVKFLKAIEDREVLPVGDTQHRKVNVRIIAATNSDLKRMVSEGSFREDLFFRLNVVPVRIPPLRARRDDIFPLISKFLETLNDRFESKKTISPEAMDLLTAYSYPGNIRELENIIERILILCPDDEIRPHHLPRQLVKSQTDSDWLDPEKAGMTLKEAMMRYERKLISSALEKHGTKAGAARALGVDPSTIVRKSRKYLPGIPRAIVHD